MTAQETDERLERLRDAFDAPHYLARNPDVAAAGADPFAHFMEVGWREGRDPSPAFGVADYLKANLDVAAAGINPFEHYVLTGREEGRVLRIAAPSNLRDAFDASYYLACNPDVAAVGADLFEHFMEVGWREGRDPGPAFGVGEYLAANPDVAAAGINPFEHYVLTGRAEGRPPRIPERSPLVRDAFDVDYYLSTNPDVTVDIDPLDHFLASGWREGRDPSPTFSLAHYLTANPDVAGAGINPFVHYVLSGRAEGRPTSADPSLRRALLRGPPALEARLRAFRQMFPDGEPSPPEALVQALRRAAPSSLLHLSVSDGDFVGVSDATAFCVSREAQAFTATGATHIHLFPAAPGLVVDFERDRPLIGVRIDGAWAGLFEAPALVAGFGAWSVGKLVGFAVHSLVGHNVGGIADVLRGVGARAGRYWIHDFSSLCAQGQLLRNDLAFCGAPPPDGCGGCGYAQRRRIQLAEHARFFQAFEITVMAPSQAAADFWCNAFPLAPAATRVHLHAVLQPCGRRAAAAGDSPLRVAFLDLPMDYKGWPIYTALAERFGGDPRYQFHYLGRYADLPPGVRFTPTEALAGTSAPLVAAVESLEIDVAVVWPLWPEPFSFAACAAVAGGAGILTNPDAGHALHLLDEGVRGLAAADEQALFDLFETGGAMALRRSAEGSDRFDLVYSRLTADFGSTPFDA